MNQADFLRNKKQRFLDQMSVAWDVIVAAVEERPPYLDVEESADPSHIDTLVEVHFKNSSTVVACHPMTPLQGEYDPFDPEHRKAKIVEE